MSVTFGILAEHNDKRVALVPKNVGKLVELGAKVLTEHAAGQSAGFSDEMYQQAGATCTAEAEVIAKADILLSIYPPARERLAGLPAEKILVSQFRPYFDKEVVGFLQEHKLQAFSLDMIPRSTLAQRMDVLSSMASIAGYQAVLAAAQLLPRFFPMMITAAGSIKPAKVLIIGAGVAGLQAIATAKRLGAIVEAFDVRAAAKEEVQSLGARFVEVAGAQDDADAGGYAVEQTEEFKKKQAALIQEHARQADVVITTAQIRGRKAPVLVEAETVGQMRPGSVIVDLAASTGGNCALTQDEKTIVHEGVTILGHSDLAKEMPQNASELFSNNLFNLLELLIKEGELFIDENNEIVSSTLITK
ncbi:Re/Si-specific NAD(P)(+) transhydrogenase subunit alpha [Lewinella cohaerens]|uniref:Re/Si-specific NAD(P)(+) transhydrogenase subunit alpha n=1 Tax=Lewinella cohaerens TaxID=70995 RepID=UPI00036C7D6B|nr:Re/Si-specific NAD(P)(+) transhydrogenase subunit alpha [Lewinella cohaerens]